jgi:hypothetical protein
MLARVTDPITYQGFQHFITHAVWDAARIWRRLRGAARTPRCVDHRRHELSQTGDPFGRCGAPVLWGAGQDRQLPGRDDGRAVDGSAGVADRGSPVSPEGVAQRSQPPSGGANSRRRRVPGKMAAGADVGPARPRRGAADPRRARGRRVWRRHRLHASPPSLASAVCDRGLASSHGVSRHLSRPRPTEWAQGSAAIAAGACPRHPADRAARLGAGIAGARVATGDGSASVAGPTSHSHFPAFEPSCRRSSRHCCLRNNRTISNASKNCGKLTCGSNKVVLAGRPPRHRGPQASRDRSRRRG